MQQILTVLNVLLVVACFLVPMWEVLFSRDETKKGLQRITGIGKAAIVVAILSIIVGVGNYHVSQKTERSAKRILDSTKRAEDSIRKSDRRGYEDSLKSYHTYTTELLARYGLKVDTVQHRIEQIVKDSLRGTPDPILDIADIIDKSTSSERIDLDIVFISTDAASRDFDISISVCQSVDLSGPYGYNGTVRSFRSKMTLPTTGTQLIRISITKGSLPLNLLFFYVHGTYKSLKNDTPKQIDALVGYNISSKRPLAVIGETEINIRKFFLNNGQD